MNKTTVFVAVVAMATVAIVVAGVLFIVQPEGFLTFTGFIGSTIIAITGFATTLYLLTKQREDVKVMKTEVQTAVKNTNGNLERRDDRIKRLEKIIIESGHAEKLITLEKD